MTQATDAGKLARVPRAALFTFQFLFRRTGLPAHRKQPHTLRCLRAHTHTQHCRRQKQVSTLRRCAYTKSRCAECMMATQAFLNDHGAPLAASILASKVSARGRFSGSVTLLARRLALASLVSFSLTIYLSLAVVFSGSRRLCARRFRCNGIS